MINDNNKLSTITKTITNQYRLNNNKTINDQRQQPTLEKQLDKIRKDHNQLHIIDNGGFYQATSQHSKADRAVSKQN